MMNMNELMNIHRGVALQWFSRRLAAEAATCPDLLFATGMHVADLAHVLSCPEQVPRVIDW